MNPVNANNINVKCRQHHKVCSNFWIRVWDSVSLWYLIQHRNFTCVSVLPATTAESRDLNCWTVCSSEQLVTILCIYNCLTIFMRRLECVSSCLSYQHSWQKKSLGNNVELFSNLLNGNSQSTLKLYYRDVHNFPVRSLCRRIRTEISISLLYKYY